MVIYTNGCSHTAGYCIKRHQTWPHMIAYNIIGDNYSSFYKVLDFEEMKKKIGEINNSILINEAFFGVGNDYIFHRSLEGINKMISNNKKPDLVIIQWSGTNRRIHSDTNGADIYVNLYDSTELGIKFEPMGSLHTCHYVFMLQEFLKLNNISYLFFNYMAWDKSILKSPTFLKIDFDNWLDFGMGNDIILNGLIDLFKEKQFTCDSQGHPNIDGNFFINDNILNKLDKNKFTLNTLHKNKFLLNKLI
jgi:hypothetical protein